MLQLIQILIAIEDILDDTTHITTKQGYRGTVFMGITKTKECAIGRQPHPRR
jgi:hypothetical protein